MSETARLLLAAVASINNDEEGGSVSVAAESTPPESTTTTTATTTTTTTTASATNGNDSMPLTVLEAAKTSAAQLREHVTILNTNDSSVGGGGGGSSSSSSSSSNDNSNVEYFSGQLTCDDTTPLLGTTGANKAKKVKLSSSPNAAATTSSSNSFLSSSYPSSSASTTTITGDVGNKYYYLKLLPVHLRRVHHSVHRRLAWSYERFFGEDTIMPSLIDSRRGRAYLVVIAVMVMWSLVMIPLRAAFRQLWSVYEFNFAVDVVDGLIDAVFLLDLYLGFRCAVLHDGIEERRRHVIAEKYLRNGFFLDLLAAMPFHIFFSGYSVGIQSISRMGKLFKLNRLFKVVRLLEQNAGAAMLMEATKLVTAILVLCHWVGCCYFAIAYIDGFAPDDKTRHWSPPVSVLNYTVDRQYYIAFAHGVKAVTGVGGAPAPAETDLQHAYYIILGFVKIFLVAIVFQKVHRFMMGMDREDEAVKYRLRNLNAFMTARNLPSSMQHRVRQYYLHLWSLKGATDSEDVTSQLPSSLRKEVHEYTRAAAITKIEIFKNCHADFLQVLGAQLRARIYAPGDVIVQQGEQTAEMLYLNRGVAQVEYDQNSVNEIINNTDGDHSGGSGSGSGSGGGDGTSGSGGSSKSHKQMKQQHSKDLGEGAVLGDVGLVFPSMRAPATVRALTWCEFAALESEDFVRLTQRHPLDRHIVRKAADRLRLQRELAPIIAKQQLLTGFLPEDTQALVSCFHFVEYKANDVVIGKGQPCDAWLFLARGSAESAPKAEDEHGYINRSFWSKVALRSVLTDPEYFVEHKPSNKTVRATEDGSVVLLLPSADFVEFLRQRPHASKCLVANYSVIQGQSARGQALRNRFRAAVSRVVSGRRFSGTFMQTITATAAAAATHRDPDLPDDCSEELTEVLNGLSRSRLAFAKASSRQLAALQRYLTTVSHDVAAHLHARATADEVAQSNTGGGGEGDGDAAGGGDTGGADESGPSVGGANGIRQRRVSSLLQ